MDTRTRSCPAQYRTGRDRVCCPLWQSAGVPIQPQQPNCAHRNRGSKRDCSPTMLVFTGLFAFSFSAFFLRCSFVEQLCDHKSINPFRLKRRDHRSLCRTASNFEKESILVEKLVDGRHPLDLRCFMVDWRTRRFVDRYFANVRFGAALRNVSRHGGWSERCHRWHRMLRLALTGCEAHCISAFASVSAVFCLHGIFA